MSQRRPPRSLRLSQLALVPLLALLGLAADGLPPAAPQQAQLFAAYGKLPLHFEPNQGQAAAPVAFLARSVGATLFLTPAEAVLVIPRGPEKNVAGPAHRGRGLGRGVAPDPMSFAGDKRPSDPPTVLRMQVLGGDPAAAWVGLEELPGKSNYFIGNDPQRWRTNIPHYARVRARNVYPGIDWVFYGTPRQHEYDFVVAPGVDPGAIRLGFPEAKGVRLDGDGNLIVQTLGGEVIQHAPRVYQEVAGRRQPIASRYLVSPTGVVGFEVATYDRSRPLVIDPGLSYSTYSGVGAAIAVDGAGHAYVTGGAVVMKLNPTGSALVYSTYLEGASVYGIAVDGAGHAYVTGETSSFGFPTTPGAFQQTLGGDEDAFVTKLDPAGSALVYSTYLGGNDGDYGRAIAVDGAGSAYVTGNTESADFPTTPGAFQTGFSGSIYDAFVTKLDPVGSAPVYSTYLGGKGGAIGRAIAVDGAGSAYVTGTTSPVSFPTTPGAFQTTYNGGIYDAFVTKLDPAGSALGYSTYLGGNGSDTGYAIAVDGAGHAYLTGGTASPNFPTTPGAFQAAYGGGLYDAFVTKLDPAGSAPLYSTYLGGNMWDFGWGLAVDGAGHAYVAGDTFSPNFPTTSGAFQQTLGGPGDAFVTKLDPSGSALLYSTFLGGAKLDRSNGIAADSTGHAYVTGSTTSSDFPTTAGAFQTVADRGAFVTKLSTGVLGFPLASLAPESAEIRAVFDHSVTKDQNGVLQFYAPDGKVTGYTGEAGLAQCGVPGCGLYLPGGVVGYKNGTGTPFVVNGHYTGGGDCVTRPGTAPCNHWLFAEGHPGYDYAAALGTPILAPADGVAFIPERDPILNPRDPVGAVAAFNMLAVDHGGGFATWYLHLGNQATGEDLRVIQCPGEMPHLIQPGERIPVTRGCQIGKVGDKGGAAPQLHFEVRRGVVNFQCPLPSCFPVDPYGWTDPTGPDPYPGGPNVRLWE